MAKPFETQWAVLREHPSFRAGAVYAGAAFVLLQVLDLLDVPTGAIRWVSVLLALGFVLLTGVLAATARLAPVAGLSARLPGGRRLAASLVLLFGLGLGAWWAGGRLLGSTVAPGAEVIAVLPFTTSGPSGEALAEGMVDLVSTSLDQVGGVRAIHPRTVMHRWTQRAVGTGGGLDLGGSLEVGRDVGAGSVLLGSLVQVGARVRLSAELYTVAGARIGEARTEGAADSVLALVDDLAVRMLREVWRSREPIPHLRLAGITTSSVDALRDYLRGERHYRASEWDAAVAAFTDAIGRDSTFALAHLRLAESYGWLRHHGDSAAVAHSRIAARLADRLPTRDASLARAQLLHEEADPAVLDSLERFVRRYPDDVMGWAMLSDARFHSAAIHGATATEVIEPVDTALRLDPGLASPLVHVMETLLLMGDSAGFDQRVRQYERAGGDATEWRITGALQWGPQDSLQARFERAFRTLRLERPVTTTWFAWGWAPVRRPDLDPDLVDGLADIVRAGGRVATPEWAAPLFELQSLLVRGRAEAALRLKESSGDRLGPGFAFAELFAATMVGVVPADAMLRVMPPFEIPAQRLWFETQLALARGDADHPVISTLLETTDLALPDDAPPFVEPGFLALKGWATVLRGDTARGLAMMTNGLGAAPYDYQTIQALLPVIYHRAVLLSGTRGGRAEGIARLEALLLRGPQYLLAPLHLALADAREADGRREAAARHYAEVVRLWAGADAALQPQVEVARRGLERVAVEGPRQRPPDR